MKKSKKIAKQLEIRIKDFKGIVPKPGYKFHQPGSQNGRQ